MFSKKILCGVVAYTTLASGSVGSYAAGGGIEYKNIPSVIVDNPLPIAGVLTAITAAILTYRILAKNYGEKIPSENYEDEKGKENLHEDLPDPEKSSEVKEPEKDPGEVKVEPTNGSKENENNLGRFNIDFLKNNIEKWHIYLGAGVIATAAIIYLIHKHIKEAPYKKAFERLKKVWDICCENLKNLRINIGGKEFNGRKVFRALVDLRKDQQGNPVFVFGKRKIELKLSGGKIIEIDKNIYTNKKKQEVYYFDLVGVDYYVGYMTRIENDIDALVKKYKKDDNVMNIKNEKNEEEMMEINEENDNNKKILIDKEGNENFEDRELRKLIAGVDKYDYREFLIKEEDTPKAAFNKLVGLWNKIYKNLEGVKVPFYNKNSLDGQKVFRAMVDLREDEQGKQMFVFGKGIWEKYAIKLKLEGEEGKEENGLGKTRIANLGRMKEVFIKFLEISNNILNCPDKIDLTSITAWMVDLDAYDNRDKKNFDQNVKKGSKIGPAPGTIPSSDFLCKGFR